MCCALVVEHPYKPNNVSNRGLPAVQTNSLTTVKLEGRERGPAHNHAYSWAMELPFEAAKVVSVTAAQESYE
ncbi:uncharacterized protein ARMOST_17719 [Armillaria ostoyae]|uniref:Uncharacterized protein n=1 Tax=Armillaria ostoyae TaxID=47428 RepID=A0A284RZR5_ARMOS|nr:uncharacterized protein ARMOST_17719 [Armillaria ostoyae]